MKNDKMTKQIQVIKRNLSLSKNNEKQLAKRAFNCQSVISDLKGKFESLEKERD